MADAAKFRVSNTQPRVRRLYRDFRRAGVDRRDANLIIWGVVLGNPELGAVTIDELPHTRPERNV